MFLSHKYLQKFNLKQNKISIIYKIIQTPVSFYFIFFNYAIYINRTNQNFDLMMIRV